MKRGLDLDVPNSMEQRLTAALQAALRVVSQTPVRLRGNGTGRTAVLPTTPTPPGLVIQSGGGGWQDGSVG